MIYRKTILRLPSALLLALLPVVFAHGDGDSMDMKMDMGMGHVSNTTQPPKDQDYPNTYFAHTDHSGVIYTHIALMILSWVFLLPIGKSPAENRSSPTYTNLSRYALTGTFSLYTACATCLPSFKCPGTCTRCHIQRSNTRLVS